MLCVCDSNILLRVGCLMFFIILFHSETRREDKVEYHTPLDFDVKIKAKHLCILMFKGVYFLCEHVKRMIEDSKKHKIKASKFMKTIHLHFMEQSFDIKH